jgi:dTDP-4-dehydrorhamnose reductase
LRILLTGKTGQVGWELARALPALGEVITTDRSMLDLARADLIRRVIREAKPDVIVNAAAYTAVDKAESESDLAMRINAFAPGVLAEEAKRLSALLVHYSTDYVFDGAKAQPYSEGDIPNPINEYGRSKLAGEHAIQAAGCRHLIFRTSWVYAPRGRNFLLTILKTAREKLELKVVADQFGAPTSSAVIADATARLLRARGSEGEGLYHMSAAGRTSWQGFAEAIVRAAGLTVPVLPILSADYPAAARRPRNSVLDNHRLRATFGMSLPDWQTQLESVMGGIFD